MHCDARALDLCPCITRDVPYDARMMHRDALMRLMHLGLGDAWCIKAGRLSTGAVTGRGISSRQDGRGHQHSVAGIAVFSAVVTFGPLH